MPQTDQLDILFITQSSHRIEAGGMASRQHASDRACCGKRDDRSSKVDRVSGRNLKEQ
jgi:hypothetical protein